MTDQTWFPEAVRQRAANAIRQRRDILVADLDVLIGTALPEPPQGDVRARLVRRLIELFATALSGGDLADDAGLPDLAALQREGLKRRNLFAAVRLAESSILHELSVDTDLGATSDDWPAVTIIVRRASFDLLAGVFDYVAPPPVAGDPGAMPIARPVFEIAVAKELQRGIRYRHPLALVLLQLDDLAVINERHGYGVGDLLMERFGVLVQRYFREPDWVARYGTDSIAVLLPETSARDARTLAQGAAQAVEKRLAFTDDTEQPVRVTASASVVTVALRGKSGRGRDAPDATRLLNEAESSVSRARARGGNAVECVELTRDSLSVAEAAARLRSSPATVRKLVAAGTLPAVETGGHTRIDRIAVEAYGKRQRPSRKAQGSRLKA